MKQSGLLTIITLTALLISGCGKKDDHSAEVEQGTAEDPAVKKEFKIPKTITKTAAEEVPEVTAMVEGENEPFTEEVTKYDGQENLPPEEALSASFHGQIENVLNDLYTSAEEVKHQVDLMSDDEVIAYADEYLSVVRYVKDKITALTGELEQMDISDMAGSEAREIQAQLSQAQEQLNLLKERYVFYIGRLEHIGVSMREYGY